MAKKKETSPEVSATAARLMGMSDDQILEAVLGRQHIPGSISTGVGFPQFCRDMRAVAASALAQDETKG